MPEAPEAKVRARVGAIGFSGLAANNAVKTLSGGEKARLLLGLATFAAPHLIILDEPTNHLDIDSRAALIEAINDYPGAVILVSHDRYLLEACADRLWLVAGRQGCAVRRRSRRLPARRARRRERSAREQGGGSAPTPRRPARCRRQARRNRAAAQAHDESRSRHRAAEPAAQEARRDACRRRPVRARARRGRRTLEDARQGRRGASPRRKRNGSPPAPRWKPPERPAPTARLRSSAATSWRPPVSSSSSSSFSAAA